MRDGTILRADVYRPKVDGKRPVLLTRTPYNRRNGAASALRMAARGYVVVVQDVRGRYSSAGEWNPFRFEALDGYDTVEWAAALPYGNGQVGMFGGSYVGATQMLASTAHPPHLAGICPLLTASNYHEGWTYQGGAFAQWFNQSWASGLAEDTLDRRARQPRPWADWNSLLPLSRFAGLEPGPSDGLMPYYRDWLEHPASDDYWRAISVDTHHADITVPALHIGGWYDIFQGGTWRNYVGLRNKSASAAARAGQRLIMGPWGHAGLVPKVGELDFGPAAEFALDDVIVGYYDRLFSGEPNPFAHDKPVKIFVMGTNVWRQEDNWPLARARPTRFFLRSAGKANGLRGDGTLSTAAPVTEPADRFTYDPADPVPTRGGGLCCMNNVQPVGPWDQRATENRPDVLVYTTTPVSRDTEVTGPISVELFVESSAVDTDFTAKLVDVWPNGYAQNLTDGILRMRYRASPEKAELVNPGQTYPITVDLLATSNVFRTGHRIRLEVSSSNHPRFDRNLNTGESAAFSARFVKANNVVWHDRMRPSAVVLPMVDTAAP